MEALEVVVALGLAVLAGHLAARALGVAPPLTLLAAGVLLGVAPRLRHLEFPPEVVLFLLLPVLLYWESLTASLRAIRASLRGIVLTSTLLVVATSAGVAFTAHASGVPWGPAWVLGAAVAPTDATAVSALVGALPRGFMSVLRAESLVNDGTALVVYGLAVGLTVGEEALTVPHVSQLVVVSYGGGVLAGVVTAVAGFALRRRMRDALHINVLIVLMPFVAFLLAELVHASGVLAVVVCGLIGSQWGPRVGLADQRLQTQAFWSLSVFAINGALFVLVGLELWAAAAGLTSFSVPRALALVVAVTVTLAVVRLAFLVVSAHTIRLIDRRPQQRARRVSERARVLSALSGFRGAVSLALALAVPTTLDSGQAFPDRDLIVFVTSGVIVLTLVPALFLGRVVGWARLPSDTSLEDELRAADEALADEAQAAVGALVDEIDPDPAVLGRVKGERAAMLATEDPDLGRARELGDQYRRLRLAMIARKRTRVIELRDAQVIDDVVLRQIQARLDIEEVRMNGWPFDE